jgi:hypothetical protein
MSFFEAATFVCFAIAAACQIAIVVIGAVIEHVSKRSEP